MCRRRRGPPGRTQALLLGTDCPAPRNRTDHHVVHRAFRTEREAASRGDRRVSRRDDRARPRRWTEIVVVTRWASMGAIRAFARGRRSRGGRPGGSGGPFPVRYPGAAHPRIVASGTTSLCPPAAGWGGGYWRGSRPPRQFSASAALVVVLGRAPRGGVTVLPAKAQSGVRPGSRPTAAEPRPAAMRVVKRSTRTYTATIPAASRGQRYITIRPSYDQGNREEDVPVVVR
jgi:hypothetical protein